MFQLTTFLIFLSCLVCVCVYRCTNLCANVNACSVCTNTYVYEYECVCTRVYKCTNACVCVCVYEYVMRVCVYECVYECVCACTSVQMRVCVCTNTYVYECVCVRMRVCVRA